MAARIAHHNDCDLPVNDACVSDGNRSTSCAPRTMRPSDETSAPSSIAQRTKRYLSTKGIVVSASYLQAFAQQLTDCQRREQARKRFMSSRVTRAPLDMLRLIHAAMDSDEPFARDEALWRIFVAAHFGYPSSGDAQSTSSAGRFLCAFGEEPYWTWSSISVDLPVFASWLQAHEVEFQTLKYGNHRKFESKHAHDIYAVIASFVTWVHAHGGTPTAAFSVPNHSDPHEVFRLLYERMRTIYRFGRTARFDLLTFATDVGALSAEADSCYLSGATGPYHGAVLLCGNRPIAEFTAIVDDLARTLGATMGAMEDTLCIWQK